ncbi:polysaccharide biosynthesis tyrosine autokinase [uncultured Tateyamaria sp.]|uniref:polysaccharide biosynthesis tyrosine autokinase n=1 Tax=uncultured Tateyamaria sp. TaxID=455651 RepID=UPI002608C2CE|nr:polysaccharide biosynthesis tyrosine autokinase [uncultured Tateyamaria sp.]
MGQSNATSDSDVINLGALLGTIWRGKWLIALTTAIAIAAGIYYAYVLATPKFRATAVVILKTNQEQIVDLQSVVGGLSGDSSEVNSEVEVLRARSLMGKVVDKLDLTTDAEFNIGMQEPKFIDVAIDEIKGVLGLNNPPVVLSPEDAAKRRRDAVISNLLNAVTVRNVPLSLVFQVTVETENARKSALIADTIVDLYVLNQIEVKFEATQQATIWLSERVSELQSTLEMAEAEVSAFSASTELVSIEGLQALERQIKDLRDRIDTAESNRVALDADIAALEGAVTREEQVQLAEDAQLTRLLQRAANDDAIAQAFDTRLAQVLQRKQAELTRADQQLRALRGSEIELNRALDQQGEDLITLQQLTREAEATRVLYEYFLTRFNETSAQQGIQQADSRILSDAVIPLRPAEPRKPLVLALAAIIGIFIGSVVVVLREMRNNGFRTAQDLEAFTGYSVLGQIPSMPSSMRSKVLKYLADKPTSAAAEAIRNLRTSIMLSNVDNPPQVIISTSSVPGEGKTTNSLSLAFNLLGLGKKVLLIEGDIRRRTLNEYFPNVPKHGIVSVLNGDKTLEEAVFKGEGFGADVLAGEKTNVNAADLFASEKFKDLIRQVREVYDVVIIDTPPVLVVPDARIIAEQVDAIIFTVQWDKTSRPQVEEALRMFHNSGQRVTGLVLSQISVRGMKRYGYGGQYGAYAGYGSKYYID